MKRILILLFFLIGFLGFSQDIIGTWNVKYLIEDNSDLSVFVYGDPNIYLKLFEDEPQIIRIVFKKDDGSFIFSDKSSITFTYKKVKEYLRIQPRMVDYFYFCYTFLNVKEMICRFENAEKGNKYIIILEKE